MLRIKHERPAYIMLDALYNKYGETLSNGHIEPLENNEFRLTKNNGRYEITKTRHLYMAIVNKTDEFVRCRTDDGEGKAFTFTSDEFATATGVECNNNETHRAINIGQIVSLNTIPLFVAFGSLLAFSRIEQYQMHALDEYKYALFNGSNENALDGYGNAIITDIKDDRIIFKSEKTSREFELTPFEFRIAYVRRTSTESAIGHVFLNNHVRLDFSPMFHEPPSYATYDLSQTGVSVSPLKYGTLIQTANFNDPKTFYDIICGDTLFHNGDDYYVININDDAVLFTDAQTRQYILKLSLSEMTRIRANLVFGTSF